MYRELGNKLAMSFIALDREILAKSSITFLKKANKIQIAESEMLCIVFQNMRNNITSLTTELLIVDGPVVFVVSPSSSSDDDIPRSSKLNSASSSLSVSP